MYVFKCKCREIPLTFCFDFVFEKVLLTKFVVILSLLIAYLHLLHFGMTLNSFDVTAESKENNFEFGIKDMQINVAF